MSMFLQLLALLLLCWLFPETDVPLMIRWWQHCQPHLPGLGRKAESLPDTAEVLGFTLIAPALDPGGCEALVSQSLGQSPTQSTWTVSGVMLAPLKELRVP